MREFRTSVQEASEDIFFGQEVIIWARWFVILAASLVLLWTSNNIAEMQTASIILLPLISINFYVHGRYLMEKPVNQRLLMVMNVSDVAIVTLIVLSWQEGKSFASPYFVFYYPLILAFAFVMPPRFSIAYTILTLVVYSMVCLLDDPSMLNSSLEIERLMIRIITLASMGGLGMFYWRIQRQRRRNALSQHYTPLSVKE
jgi:membrane-associated HD superfamily phosphohydrolase